MQGDFAIAWLVSWARQLPHAEVVKKAKFMSLQQQFCTKTEAQAFKAELQVDGYIASIKPLFRSRKERERAFKRRQINLADENGWPLQARMLTN